MIDDRSRKPFRRGRRRGFAWAAGLVAATAAAAGLGALAYSEYVSTTDDTAFYTHWGVDSHHLPYDSNADARADIAAGKARAEATGKLLMVTFGANWCPDCLTLHKNLEDPLTRDYAR